MSASSQPPVTNPGSGSDPTSGPRQVTNVAVLAESDRELLLLVGWEGLSQAEAATALGISPGAARVRLHRARKRVLSTLEKQGPAGPDQQVTTLYAKEQAS